MFTKRLRNKVLFRYLMKELFLYFIIAFLFFFMIFFVNQILLMAEDVLKKRVPLTDVLLLMLYSLPFIIAQSAPFATLVGFLMCLGRLASDNEIMVLRAAGRSFMIILVPVLLSGLLISIFSFFVNDYLLPIGTLSYNKLYRSILLSNPAIELESNSIKRTEDSTIVIGTVDGRVVTDMVFFDTDEKGNQRIITAGNTQINEADDPSVIMQMDMSNASVTFLDKEVKTTFDFMQAGKTLMNVFSSTFFNQSTVQNPREMTSFDLKNEIEKLRGEGISELQLNMYKLEYYKKFSLPFGSLFFAMLAMPLAIIFGKHNGQTIGLIFGLFISVIYWAMLIMGQMFGNLSGLSGFWMMWGPNFLIGAIGIALYLKLVQK